FLHSPTDSIHLQQILQQYSSVSNTALGYSKTQALLLSGADHLHWKPVLHAYQITSWHDRTSSSPLIYLGFPICSNIIRRNTFITQLFASIRAQCFLQGQRRLSIRG
ncbi:hypothetical protein BD560DRAFT_305741, partial [Blakeslea trispora]